MQEAGKGKIIPPVQFSSVLGQMGSGLEILLVGQNGSGPTRRSGPGLAHTKLGQLLGRDRPNPFWAESGPTPFGAESGLVSWAGPTQPT